MPPFPPPPPPIPPTARGGASAASGSPQPPAFSAGARREPEIVAIPEKYYGLALKMKGDLPAEASPVPVPAPRPVAPPVGPASRPSRWPIVLIVLVLLLGIGGGFTYLNRDLLFKKPAPATPAPVPPPAIPNAPANLSAKVSGLDSVALTWVDAAIDETGYRLERRESGGTFLPLTTLPANSAAFLDVSPQLTKSYEYRVIAMNAGGESSPSNSTTITMPAEAVPPTVVTPVPTLPPGGLDSDSDGLTDGEEILYGTDAHVPDTDKDGFLDGNEVFHLYNPAAVAPTRLLDSGLVTLFTAPAGWSLYVPKVWSARLDQPDGSKATIDTKHGETIVIALEENSQHLPLLDWYLAKNPGTLSSSVRTIRTKSNLEGIQDPERLTMYFAWDGKVFSIKYDIDGQSFINYRTTFEMILNSLQLTGAPIVTTPSSAPLEGPGAIVPTAAPASTTTSTSAATSTSSATGTQP